MVSRRELEQLLAPWLSRLDEVQIRWLNDEAADIERRWPGPDYQLERESALAAAVRWVTGEITTVSAGQALLEAHERAALALAAARQIARMAVLHGMPEAQAALESGVEPTTLKRDLTSCAAPLDLRAKGGTPEHRWTGGSPAAACGSRSNGDKDEGGEAACKEPGNGGAALVTPGLRSHGVAAGL